MEQNSQKREKLSSRMGFLLISAGCAIGLGNVWRFPYIAGQYGGGAFVLLYLVFLVILGLPIMVMEFSVGRASRKSVAASFQTLEKKGQKWHWFSYFAMAGNYLLMMFYTTIGGFTLYYFFKMASGGFSGKNSQQVAAVFTQMTANPVIVIFWMVVVVLLGFGVCALGLNRGVERVTKIIMCSLFGILLLLVVRAVTLPGAADGLAFYLVPDFSRMAEAGFANAIFAAMGQAFFTLGLGVGSLAIFGSYIDKNRSLTGEAVRITALDTLAAFLSGLIIFPACFAFGISPDSGPNLVFVTLPNMFNAMPFGRLWGALFFLFLAFAALSSIIAVFENIISFGGDRLGWSRKKAIGINIGLVILLSLPVALGFNLLSGIQPIGIGTSILDLEDFVLSNNLLPLGCLVYLLFCTRRYGWGFENFLEEANAGKGMRFPKRARFYVSYLLPLLILVIFIQGYLARWF